MKITSLKQQKKSSSRLNLFVDDDFIVGISVNTLVKFNLYEGKEIGQELLEEVLNKELEQRFLQRAILSISKSPKTVYQIERYLADLKYRYRDKWFDSNTQIDFDNIFRDIIEKLKQMELLDDREYARMFVESRIKNRPRGKRVLISELMSKGVNKDVAQDVCNNILEDEYEVLERTFEKRFKGEKFNIWERKQVDFLLRKGFNYDLIKEFAKNESSE